MSDKSDMYSGFGGAAVILSLCLGVGSCSFLVKGSRYPDAATEARLSAIESRKCTLMAVTTPTGTASICAGTDQ